MRRTLKDELNLWHSWRNSSPIYKRRRGLDHNRPLFGILAFAYEQGWIPNSLLYALLLLMLEVIALIPISLLPVPELALALDFSLMFATSAFLSVRLWLSSKLVFVCMAPMVAFSAGLSLLLWHFI